MADLEISSSELQATSEKLNYVQFGNLKLRAAVRGPMPKQVSRTAFRVGAMVHLHKKLFPLFGSITSVSMSATINQQPLDYVN